MKKSYNLLFTLTLLSILFTTAGFSQINLYTQDFEGSDEDNYTLTNALGDNIDFGILGNNGADYILRANPSTISFIDVQPTGFGGSNVMVWEDVDDYIGDLFFLSNSFDITGAQDIVVSLKVGITNDGLDRYENENFIVIEYDLDGADNWIKIGDFRGIKGPPFFAFNFYEDDNLDGTYTVQTTNAMRTVNYNLNNRAGNIVSGTSMRIRIRINSGIQEEMVIDDITVNASTVLSVDELVLDRAISIFPNPSNGLINVKNSGIELLDAIVTNINGRTITTFDLDSSREDFQLDISSLVSSGIYFLKLTSQNSSIIKKLIIN